ncbi:TOBE domain-containing protein [Pseudaminobacter soli (ex Li et al. 2025)]|uniref:TOBE domain-containing protein n=1 Tax=Pseudaminobacter soli (ex Li et al. 2025) TaxID=1295366 RepID=UPI001FE08E97|nr:TOBE domain-containing protein [Mesorhizobium soli]
MFPQLIDLGAIVRDPQIGPVDGHAQFLGQPVEFSQGTATCAARPEDIRIGVASLGEVGFKATVYDVSFVGALERIALGLPTGEQIVAALHPDTAAVMPGQLLGCRIALSAIDVLPASRLLQIATDGSTRPVQPAGQEMPIALRPVTVPDFGLPLEQPAIPAAYAD